MATTIIDLCLVSMVLIPLCAAVVAVKTSDMFFAALWSVESFVIGLLAQAYILSERAFGKIENVETHVVFVATVGSAVIFVYVLVLYMYGKLKNGHLRHC